ncbi:MAG: alkaline shock response membrane anchor protein AmaP [Candidatus Omnitrophota bacterium]|nr:MAG: alkaline shock response membrane anchor protein AmaP [Candidatus Omnitrophota bacterium]RKY38833.1 MAG: alkaline shock response membrane anchor protein AmaP [Candidatus Omnitrophota bacterium]RKY46116.1 MAG: alkaline shock response membrane anchor protein AmaP [Candidatus Omnitrophota bacterium]HDN86184.1 alkaline shock response membrane anchor protein AmaP [Candidatus Omnitrophota bacterium]
MGIISIVIYVIISFLTGILFLSLWLNILTPSVIAYHLEKFLSDPLNQLTLGLLGLVAIFACLAFLARLSKGRREKAIVIQTSQGVLTIGLTAIEDMIKKMFESKEELVYVKPKAFLTRKGLEILIRGSLNSEINLAEFSLKVQEEIKRKIEHILGGTTEIKVNLEIKKFSFSPRKEKSEEVQPQVPFRNY